MARHFISVCIFCFICATHSPCASHAEVAQSQAHRSEIYNDPNNNPPLIDNIDPILPDKIKAPYPAEHLKHLSNSISNLRTNNVNTDDVRTLDKRFSDNIDSDIVDNKKSNNEDVTINPSEDEYLQKLFHMFGDGETMTYEGFEKLVTRLGLVKELLNKQNETKVLAENATAKDKDNEKNNSLCINSRKFLAAIAKPSSPSSRIDSKSFQKACPAIVYGLMQGGCAGGAVVETDDLFHVESVVHQSQSAVLVWVYSLCAVFLISACGVLALVVIPVMQKKFYKPLLQFLVALAVGTLAGDAFLHLLPHAMSAGTEGAHHEHEFGMVHAHGGEAGGGDDHDTNMWKGFVAMLGVTFFFIMERFIQLIAKWRKGKQQRHKAHTHAKVISTDTAKACDTMCVDKYNAYQLCYRDILNDPNTTFLENDKTATTMLNELGSGSDFNSFTKSNSNASEKIETNQNMTECPNDSNNTTCTEMNKMLPDEECMVILSEHQSKHHGHSHGHGHVHAAPKNFSSVAWMVIMGDGLHNFTDGMAIGAAFAGSAAGGFSTAVAVFCHELPHELGDFAMLLKAGMSIKQALFYNLLSSVLCVLGNIFGVWLGNTESASSWVFAAAAGMFVYIALVDMIPELSSGHEDEGSISQFFLHFSGLVAGFGIMTLIALYEHDLKTIFNET